MNLNLEINTHAHYLDDRFASGGTATCFGRKASGLHYTYDDRLSQWDHDKYSKACQHATDNAPPSTGRWHQEMLTYYCGKPVQLRHILKGVNVSNGYPYLVYGYKVEDDK